MLDEIIKDGYYGLASIRSKSILGIRQSIFCISDPVRRLVFVIPLTIGCFSDMYALIDEVLYRGGDVVILPMSIQYDYFSDIYNAVTIPNYHIGPKESMFPQRVRWAFPDVPSTYSSEQFEVAQRRESVIVNDYDNNLIVSYKESGKPYLYDILINANGVQKYFSLYMTSDKLQMLLDDDTIQEIHMCANESRHGGICALDILNTGIVKNKKYLNKFSLFNFANSQSLQYIGKVFNRPFHMWSMNSPSTYNV